MTTLALPKVKGAIEGRRHRLDSDLAHAAAAKQEAETALTAYQKTLADARAAAQDTLRQTGAKLAAEAAERQRQLTATLTAQIEAAEARIASSKEQALGEIRTVAAEVGSAMVEKLTGAAPDGAAMTSAVNRIAGGRAA